MYAVVTLQDSDEVMVVSSHWLSSDKKQSYWPPFKSPEKCMQAVQNRHKPETGGKTWEKLNISFHKENGTFDKAIEGKKEIEEQRKMPFLLAGLKKQKLESNQAMLQPLPSTSRMPANDKEELLHMLRDIKSTVQENSSMLKDLLKDNTASEAPSSTSLPTKNVKTSLKLPLKTFEDVKRTERELNTAPSRKKYIKYLSGLGGFGPKDVIKYIMQRVLTDDLAKEFNWLGRGDKRPLSKLILADVIREAALKRNVTVVDCETEIKRYLSYKADRLGRKRPREQGGLGPEIFNVASSSPMDNQPKKGINWNLLDD